MTTPYPEGHDVLITPAPTPVRILQIYCVALFVIPSSTVIEAIGAAAFPAGLIGLVALGLWAAWTLLGYHNPLTARTPVRSAIGALWVASLLSYVAMQFHSRSTIEVNAADRWVLFLASLTGALFLASECLFSVDDVKRVLRALMCGGSFCGGVAALQYWFHFDLAPWIGQMLPGFSFTDPGSIQFRAGLSRVAGTTLHPIELGTTAAMLLPIAVCMAIHDRDVTRWKRVLPAVLIGLCIPMSVSKSAVLGAVVAMGTFIALLPARQRFVGVACIPVALVGVFLTVRGIFVTMTSLFLLAKNDPSTTTRTEDFPLVAKLVGQHPWFGRGGGTYLPTNFLEILDNTFYKWVIEFGLIGLGLLIVFFYVVPMITAFFARKRAQTPELMMLCGGLGAGMASCALSSFTFDSFSFPTYTCVLALLVGLTGACWRLTGPPPLGRGTKG